MFGHRHEGAYEPVGETEISIEKHEIFHSYLEKSHKFFHKGNKMFSFII